MADDTHTVNELASVLRRAGFTLCDNPACNCGSWHHRYGLPQRMAEIVDALHEADVLNNSTGNLPLRAIEKLMAERDELKNALHYTVNERDALAKRWGTLYAWIGMVDIPKAYTASRREVDVYATALNDIGSKMRELEKS